jgi:hypothetical protein
VGVPGRPKCWWMAHKAMNSLVDPEVICRCVVAHGQQDRPGGIIAGQVDGAVQAGGDLVHQPLGLQGLAEGSLDLDAGLLDRDDLTQPLARDQVFDRADRHPGAGEVGGVEDPQHPGPILDPVGERLAHAAGGAGQRPQPEALGRQDPLDAGRRHPHPAQIRATVGELAVGAVDFAPLMEQLDDLGDLLGQQPMDRTTARVAASTLGGTRPLSPNTGFPPPAAA